ncbi:MAG TPA: T9SS type A sorting domain-containing protein, partial [Candidatus Marinimicrobia bacterium]|nr:T9SS type A sorting domain-containing protein [Candidatus Neomarinimicrobiota bacterium]
DISPAYIAYLDSMENEYLALLPGADDTQTMKAHMGLAVLQAAWTHINGDTLINDLDYLFNDLRANSANILIQSLIDILPLFLAENPNDFVTQLTEFFESGTYPAYRDSIQQWLENISSDKYEMESALEWFFAKTDPIAEMFGDNWDAVADGTADFEYSVQLAGTEYEDTLFVFSRALFDRLERISQLGENMGAALDSGVTQVIDSLNANSADIEPGVIVMREGLDSLYSLLDSVQVLLWNQPFAPLELDLALIDSLQGLVEEFDSIMAGKEYPIGPDSENKTFRPRGIIESLAHHDGIWGVYQDFYRTGEEPEYTFSNIFPNGVTADMYAMIASDIILNANDTQEQFETKLHLYQKALLTKEALTPSLVTPDEHFGIALTLLYDMLNDEEFFGDIDRALYFISEGYIDSLIFYYDWSSFDLQDQISEIRRHIDKYIESDELTNYVILIKENDDGLGSYILGPDSEFSITYLTVPHVIMVTGAMELAIDAMSMIADGLSETYAEMSNIFILDLDPSVLDFSNVESELDIILILEQSNPEFLTVTPYGIEKFHEAGAWLEDAFLNLGTFFDNMVNLMIAIKPYEDDFGMDATGMEFIMDMMSFNTWEMYEDFAYPDSTTWIEGERVNLSAWFDNPPSSFLTMWKNFVLGTDSTLGGMFPDRYKEVGVQEAPNLPVSFALHPVYPNPFNPVATISFDLPEAADVSLSIVNLKGEIVGRLHNGPLHAGKIKLQWNASSYPSGIYFLKMSVNDKMVTRKMTLMK